MLGGRKVAVSKSGLDGSLGSGDNSAAGGNCAVVATVGTRVVPPCVRVPERVVLEGDDILLLVSLSVSLFPTSIV